MIRRLAWPLVAMFVLLLPRHAVAQDVVEYYGTDAIGSVRIVFDASGNIVGRMDYGPFGEQVTVSTVGHKSYAGLFRDGEAGLDYAEARSYQVRTGRFSAPDPVYAGLLAPQAWNLYSYALNSPLVFVDPEGLEACTLTSGKPGFCTTTTGTISPYSHSAAQLLAEVWEKVFGQNGYMQQKRGSTGTGGPGTPPAPPPGPPPGPGPPGPPAPPQPPPDDPRQATIRPNLPSCTSETKRGEGGFISVQTVPRAMPGGGTVAWGAYMYDTSSNFGPWAATVTVNGRLDDAKTPPSQFYPPHGAISPRVARPGSIIDIRVLHLFANPKDAFLPDVSYGKLTCEVR